MKKSVSKIVIFNFMHSLCKLAITILVAMMFCFTGVASALNTPVLEWSWTSSPVIPTSINVMMTPSVIDLTNDGIPDVVFASTASTGGGLIEVGVLRALRGNNGSELFTVTNPSYFINTASSIATGDIDGDGMPEIIACDASGNRLIAFENDGAFKWRSLPLESIFWGAPAIADLDKDGIPEIIIGRQALDNNGNILWTGTGGRGSQSIFGSLSLVADVDVDGNPEVVAGNTVYSKYGFIKWQNVSLPDGFNAVGNFDADSNAEIVLVSGGSVWLLDHDLSIKWGPTPIPGGGAGAGGPPTIADCDGDGSPEIGVAGMTRYALFETDGTLKWAAVTQDTSSRKTGSSAFDFEGDGLAEIIYRDELNLRIYRGTDGLVLFQTPLSSCTWFEYPFVADVDGDKDAELLAVANNNCGKGPQRGIFIYGDPLQEWGHVRKIWNEHTYHITNVNSNGTIPADEQQNWLTPGLNNFRVAKDMVIIDDCETGVTNEIVAEGYTMSDLIAQCAEGANNHGKFVSCVAHLTNDWMKAGLISGKEKGKIQKCAAQADIP